MNIKFNELLSEIGNVLKKGEFNNLVSITHSKGSVFPTCTPRHVKRKKSKTTPWLIARIIEIKHISPLCLSTLWHGKKVIRTFKSFSFHIMYFQRHFGSFWLRVWRILYFSDSNRPLSNVMFSALYFKHSLLNCRLKSKEITACLQNCLKLLKRSKMKIFWKFIKIYQNQKTFLLMTYVEKNVIFWGCAAWSYHCLQKRW